MAERSPAISVIICTRDRAETLRETLRSVLKAVRASTVHCEVIVVDNGSRDATRTVVEAAQAGLSQPRYVYEPRPGLSRARNAGVERARGTYVAFTDDDCLVSREWLASICTAFEQSPEVAGVFGQVRALDGMSDRHAVAIKMTEQPQRFRFPCYPVTIGHGNNMAFRREALRAVGPFDVALGAGGPLRAGEDLDLAYRLLRHGDTLMYDPRCVISHRPRDTAAQVRATHWRNAIGLGACFGKHMLRGDLHACKCVYWFLLGLPKSWVLALRRGERQEMLARWLYAVGVPCGMLKRLGHTLLVSLANGRGQ